MSYQPVSVRRFTMSRRTDDPVYDIVKVKCGDHEIEVTVSPKGRTWHVWIDGEKVR